MSQESGCGTSTDGSMKTRHYVLLGIIYSASVALACELAGRVNFFRNHHLPFLSPASQLAYRFYPNLKPIMENHQTDCVRVLVIGASTLNRGWGDFEGELRTELSALLGQKVCVFNTSMPGRTSLDAYYKYWYLREQSFDLVIFYNGINELRANDVPDSIWKDDYSHYAWYDEANFYFQHVELTRSWVILPFYLKHLAVVLDRKVFNRNRTVPYNSERIRPDWYQYGASIKSAKPFRRNILKLLSIAQAKHEPVLLMSFASHIPSDYSLERFRQGTLGYERSPLAGTPVELWGRPEDVRKGLEIHNGILRELARSEDVLFIDQEALLGQEIKNFIDVCHFSPVGRQRLVHNIIGELKQRRFHPQRFSQSVPRQVSPTLSPLPHTPLPNAVSAPTPVMPDRTEQKHPFAFGNQVVWQDFRGGKSASIYFYDLTTRHERRVMSIRGTGEVFPKISGNRVISEILGWNGRREIYVFDEMTNKQQRLTKRDAIGMRPDIAGNLAVWTGFRRNGAAASNHYDIFLYDFQTKKEVRVTTNDSAYDDIAPAIDGQTIVWQSLRAGQSGIYLCTYDQATGTCPEKRIMADDGGRTFLVGEPDISGNLVVFSKVQVASQEHTIYLYDLATDHLERLAAQPGFQQSPQVSGHRVVWQDHRSGSWDVFCCEYDPYSQRCSEQQITHDPWTEWQPTISGNRIFWEDYRTGTPNIYMYEIRN